MKMLRKLFKKIFSELPKSSTSRTGEPITTTAINTIRDAIILHGKEHHSWYESILTNLNALLFETEKKKEYKKSAVLCRFVI